MLKNIILLYLSTISLLSFAQGTGWELKSDKEGIKVYTKPAKSDGTLQIRLLSSTTATINAVLKTSQDVSNLKERIINTQSVTVLKQISPNEAYYRLISDYPWPISDRDAIMHLVITQDPKTKIIHADTYSSPSYMAENSDYVRIYTWETHSILTPKPNGTVEIDYWFTYNTRGNVPTSLLESITRDGTFEGMKKFIQLTHLPKYQ